MPRKGENIYKRKDGRWEGRYIREKDGTKAKYGYLYGKTYTDVKKRLREIRATQVQEQCNKFQNKTDSFAYLASLWITDKRTRVKDSTWIKYQNLLNSYICPQIGHMSINNIDYAVLSGLCKELQTTGGRNKQGLSSKTVADVLMVVKNILKFACRLKYSIDMSALEVESKTKITAPRVLSLQEEQQLIAHLINSREQASVGIMICLFTGLRIGELCALTWDDISIASKKIYVHKTMQRIQVMDHDQKTKVLITEPKSQCSIRHIPIAEMLIPFLSNKNLNKGFVLTGSPNRYMEPRTMQNHFKKILNQCGIADINFHVLRHTFATRCVEVGFDIKSLSEILGHANVNITLNRYVHPSMELKQKNMDKLSEIFSVK